MSARKYWLGFNVVKGIGPVRLRALRAAFGDLEVAWGAPEPRLLAAGLDRRTVESLVQTRRTLDLDRLLDEVDAAGASVLTLDDADYPALLRELPDSPPVLYVKGTLLDDDRWAVAFVGTRRATTYGRDMAHRLVTSLVGAGITIVSGLALGIDAEAHKAALDAGGRTIAVLGSGIRVITPRENLSLARLIFERGAVLSEQPPSVQPTTATRLDVGINLKGEKVTKRLEASGSFNSMVSHRVRVEDIKQIDAELIGWLKKAYGLAG